MGDTEKCNTDMIQRLHSSFKPISLNHQLDIPHFNPNFIRSSQYPQSSQPFSDCGKRIGVPPSHPNLIPPTSPYSQIPRTRQSGPENFNPGASHSRSMSQPNSFFSFDSLPPLSPSPFRESLSAQSDHDVSMEDRNNPSLPPAPFTRCNSTSPGSLRVVGESLPPRKSHKRSNSDIPNGYNSMMGQNSLPLIPPRPLECSDGSKTTTFVKKEPSCEREGVGERESVDYLFSAYMNLDNIDALDSLEADDSKNGNENREDMESSRASATKTNCSDTEGESSSVNESGKNNTMNLVPSGEKRESVKRRAGGGDIAPTSRHYRSVSVDSCFMEKLSFGDESLKPPPSPGTLSRKVSPSNSVDENSSAALNIEFKNGEFTAAEMKKIMANDKLAEMAMADPKRVKRILANRQSAARSKERKMRYIVELEHKVQTLQNEATTLSAQLTLLQRDMIGLTNQNNELKFRLQAMEQQARLSEALNEAMNGEVQRLKLAVGETSHKESKLQSLNTEMFQQLNISKLRRLQPLPQQNQNDTLATK